MNSPEDLLKYCAVLAALIAAVCDLRFGRIPNKLTFPAILAGWLLNLFFFGAHGILYSIAATIAGIAIYFGPAIVGAIGMGDVKLMGAVGALAGGIFALNVFLYSSVLGIFHAFLILYLNYGKNAIRVLSISYQSGAFRDKTLQSENAPGGPRYKFYLGIDIFLGGILSLVWPVVLRW